MRSKITHFLTVTVTFILAILFVIKFGGPSFLKMYIRNGVGDCQKIPLLCVKPAQDLRPQGVDKAYVDELVPYKFSDMVVSLPKGFKAVKELITKVYYKKGKRAHSDAVIYLLYEKPGFFVGLFPPVTKQKIKDDYMFLSCTMNATFPGIKNITDTFFVIMKSIFIPDLGDQKDVKMARFILDDKRGFLNYNMVGADYYFDCNVFNKHGEFFKIYIKDKGGRLDLNKVLAIISTLEGTRS